MDSLRKNFITSSQEYKEGAVYLFCQKFSISDIKRVTLSITALGVYEALINGQKAGEQMFAPGFTYYHKHLYYQVYDVTKLIREGENVIHVYLGQGWYCGRFTFDNLTQIYGEQSAVAWELKVEYMDGKETFIRSGEQVDELESPYDYGGFYDGEIYHPGRDKKVIGKALFYKGKLPEIMEESLIEVNVMEEMKVQKVQTTGQEETTILDFGQNFAGIVEIDPSKMKGSHLKIRHGEILTQEGALYTANLRKAKAEIEYYKADDITEKYRPRFTYMGFRYMELTGVPYEEGLITSYALYSSMERTGYFVCKNNLVQKLYENQVWGQKSNFVEVPTDCPQRDERMGYTGDGHVFARTGSYNYDTRQFYRKFLKDIKYSQMDNTEGYIGSTAPAKGPEGIGFLSMLGWGNAITIIPEMLYWQYGDESFLLEQYDSIKLFVEAEIRKMGKKNLWIGPSLGDWLMLGKGVGWMAMHNNPVSNAFIVHDLEVIARLAKRMGKLEDADKYSQQLEKTRAAYIKKFIKSNGKMKDDYQGAYILAIQYVLQEGELREKVFQELLKHIRKNGMQTGFFATQLLLPMLADGGEVELAFDLLLQEECLGWMYQVKAGATTTWERWDALRPDGTVNETKMSADNMVSFNHYAFGSVGEFYYRYILGINPITPGYQKIRISPKVDKRLGGVSGSYESAAGIIKVSWEVVNDTFLIKIETPEETQVELPDGQNILVSKGSYEYQVKLLS